MKNLVAHGEIKIDVKTVYLDHQSDPEKGRYVFAYSIGINNLGPLAARLLSRHWVITDANGGVQEVSGDGVVGEQPLIRAGGRFEYSSGVTFPTPVGAMCGSYRMIDASGRQFEVPIPAFTLAKPGVLH